MTTQVSYHPLVGGENNISPAIALRPGELLFSQNYEASVGGGYSRIQGYERYDGLPKPSEAEYGVLEFTSGSETIAVDDVVTGDTSGATATVLAVVVDTGDWLAGDATGRVILYGVTGTFQAAEVLSVSAVPKATTTSTLRVKWSDTDTNYDTWFALAQEKARSAISVVPGEGPIRGVHVYNNEVYAFRDNAGATACKMFKATTSGWQEQNLGAEVQFTAGTSEVFVGETLTGSGGTGVITGVALTSGDWTTNDGAGYVYMKDVTGTFSAGVATTASGSLTVSGAQTVNQFSPGGRFEFINHNFYGTDSFERCYGVNGIDPAFQWGDGGLCFIHTGMTTDSPTHVEAHKKHLFLSFAGGSLQHSSLGDPLVFNVITGAQEIGVGDDITGMLVTKGILSVWSRNSTHLLYGSSSADWELKDHSITAGALPWTVQDFTSPIFVDDTGINTLESTWQFGDFNIGTMSKNIQPLIDANKKNFISSTVVKTKSQYRVFDSTGYGIFMTTGNLKLPEFMRVKYNDVVRAVTSGEINGDEVLFFGSDSGYVFQMDSGNNFDGQPIEGYLRLIYNHFKSPRNKKRFRKVILDVDAPRGTNLQFSTDFSYGDPNIPSNNTQDFTLSSGGGFWSFSNWEEFSWSEAVVGTAEAYVAGTGINLGLLVRSESTYTAPHTIQAVTVHYSVRGVKR